MLEEEELYEMPQSARNPFLMPPGSEKFDYREKQAQEARSKWNSYKKMSLVQRTDLVKPTVPPLVTTATMKVHEPTRTKQNMKSPREVPQFKTERHQRMTEFIEQKREIFLIQLMIDRKNKERNKLSNDIITEEKNLQDTEIQIEQTANQYKMQSAQIEANLARARIAAEAATKKRMELQKELKRATNAVGVSKSEILKNEDTLEAYRRYDKFMRMVAPEPFKDPKELIDYFAQMENENLFLLQQCQNIENDIMSKVDEASGRINETQKDIDVVEKKLEKVPEIPVLEETLVTGSSETEMLDNELVFITEMVSKTYTACFGKGANVTAISQLEKIEMALEHLYDEIATVKPSFVAEKQSIKDKERRENEKREANEAKVAELKRKMEAALARSNKPVKKRTGRPPVCRMLPNSTNKKNVEKVQAQMLEQQRLDHLLFDPDESD